MPSHIADMTDMKEVFGRLLFCATQIETLTDRFLRPHGVTTKQWQLSVVLEQAGGGPLSLTQAAQRMGTSRQNVKQLALKLRRRGLCAMATDPGDRRQILLSLTPKCHAFWRKNDDTNVKYIQRLFRNVKPATLKRLRAGLRALHVSIDQAAQGSGE